MSDNPDERVGVSRREDPMHDYRKLRAWKEAHSLTLQVYEITKHFPADERFGLASQVRRCAASVPSNLAEGSGRRTRSDFARFVDFAIGSANELEYQLLLARDLQYITIPDWEPLNGEIGRLRRGLYGLRRS